jgi:hypothetical protein
MRTVTTVQDEVRDIAPTNTYLRQLAECDVNEKTNKNAGSSGAFSSKMNTTTNSATAVPTPKSEPRSDTVEE